MRKSGNVDVITIGETKGVGTYMGIAEEMHFDRGYLFPFKHCCDAVFHFLTIIEILKLIPNEIIRIEPFGHFW